VFFADCSEVLVVLFPHNFNISCVLQTFTIQIRRMLCTICFKLGFVFDPSVLRHNLWRQR
jgi:hypothetical protein